MKKISVVIFLFIVLSLVGKAQNTYSSQNLQRATQEELKLYFAKAAKLKKAGAVLTIAGPSSFLLGTAIAAYTSWLEPDGMYNFGMGMVFAGIGATAAGIPILITGSSRVKKVRKAMNNPRGLVSIDLIPCSLFNYEAQKFQTGISFRVRF